MPLVARKPLIGDLYLLLETVCPVVGVHADDLLYLFFQGQYSTILVGWPLAVPLGLVMRATSGNLALKQAWTSLNIMASLPERFVSSSDS